MERQTMKERTRFLGERVLVRGCGSQRLERKDVIRI